MDTNYFVESYNTTEKLINKAIESFDYYIKNKDTVEINKKEIKNMIDMTIFNINQYESIINNANNPMALKEKYVILNKNFLDKLNLLMDEYNLFDLNV